MTADREKAHVERPTQPLTKDQRRHRCPKHPEGPYAGGHVRLRSYGVRVCVWCGG